MNWIKDNLIIILAGALAVVFVGAGIWIVSLRIQVKNLQADVNLLTSQVEVQNTRIEAWKSNAEERQKAAESALALASKWRKKYDALAGDIYNLPLPKEECHALQTLVDAARDSAVGGM